MKSIYIISRNYDPAAARTSKLRNALHTAGFSSIIVADRSVSGENSKDIIVLRERALAILMFGSQIVIAAIILGYFTRFFPFVMTVLFWSLVLVSVFIASPYGKRLRDQLLKLIVTVLARILFAQKRPDAIWLIEPDPLTQALAGARHQETVLVTDFLTGTDAVGGHPRPASESANTPRRFEHADMILVAATSKPSRTSKGQPGAGRYFSNLNTTLNALSERLK